MVLVMDSDGFVTVDKSEALSEIEAMTMAGVAHYAMAAKFMRDDGIDNEG
jgi:hypothetical protein